MKVIIFIVAGIFIIIAIIGIIGLILPKQRIVSRYSIIDASAEIVFKTIVNNEKWNYRSDLKDLIILERNEDYEVWDEISNNGNVIRFKSKEKIPHTFYSFNMESKLFTGYCTAYLKATSEDETEITATEYITFKNPFIKTLSYLFFDLGKYMETYQKDLKEKIEKNMY